MKANKLFQALSASVLKDIVDVMEKVEFKEQEIIIRQGEIGQCSFLVYSGSLSTYLKKNQENTNKVYKYKEGMDKGELINTYNEGGFFGELSLL